MTNEEKLALLKEYWEKLDFDCGDNSCQYAKKKGGMRTNGGCRCFQDIRPSENRRQLENVLRAVKKVVV